MIPSLKLLFRLIINKQYFCCLIIITSFLVKGLSQQQVLKAKNGGLEAIEVANHSTGSLVAGLFQGNLKGAIAKGGTDIFIQSYDRNHLLQETWCISGPNSEQLMALAAQPNGAWCVAGSFVDQLDLGDRLLSGQGQCSFISKHAPDGTLQWAQTLKTTGSLQVTDLLLDQAGNCYVAAYFQDTFYVGALYDNAKNSNQSKSTLQLSSGRFPTALLLKFNHKGQLLWHQVPQRSFVSKAQVLTLDETGALYAGLEVNGWFAFKEDSLQANTRYSDIVLLKLNAATGALIWQQQFGGVYDNKISALQYDSSTKQLYLGGHFMGVLKLDTFQLVTAFKFFDVFVAKLGLNGNVQWVYQSRTPTNAKLNSMAIQEVQLALGGYFEQTKEAADLSQWQYDAYIVVLGTASPSNSSAMLQLFSGADYQLVKDLTWTEQGQLLAVGSTGTRFRAKGQWWETGRFPSGFYWTWRPPVIPSSNLPFELAAVEVLLDTVNQQAQIQVKAPAGGTIEQWRLFQTSGQAIQQGKGNLISTKDLKRGIYHLEVQVQGRLGIAKLVLP